MKPAKSPLPFTLIILIIMLALAAGIGIVVWRIERRRMEFQQHVIKAAEYCQLGRMEGILVEMTYAKMTAQTDNEIDLANAIQRRFVGKMCDLPNDPGPVFF